MKRLQAVVGVVLLLMLMAAADVRAQASLDTTTTDSVWLRSGPGTQWRRVLLVPPGTPFRVDGRSAGDYWLRGITPTGEIGFILTEYLAVAPDQVAALPYVLVDTPFTLQPPPGAAPQAAPPAADGAPVATPAPLPPPAPAAGGPVTGFSYGGHVGDFSELASNAMRRAGMTWIKRQWNYIRGQSPTELAGWINDAHARGFRILIGLVGEPGEVLQQGYFDEYARFAAGVAVLGADAIEVWNEPNLDREWPVGAIDPGLYTALLAAAYNAIKASNPNTFVISGAPAPTGFFQGCTGAGCDDDRFIRGMAAAGAARYMDCLGIHYNEGILPPTQTSGDPRGNSGHYSRYYGSMVSTYWSAFNGARPLCFTELGYLSPEGFGPLPPGFEWAANTSVAEQAQWLDQVVDMARQSGRVRILIIWNIDFANYGADPMAGFAIIRPGGACPACDLLGS